MTLQHLLQTLSDRSITVWIDNGRIGYQAPAGALTDDLRRTIQGLKADLTAHLRTQEIDGSPAGGVHQIPVVSRRGPLVLSEAQEGFWFLDQLRPTGGAFNVCRAFRLSGSLDTGALQSALDQLVARHEAIRTTFASGEEGPSPKIHSPMTVQLRMGDLAHWVAAGQLAELDRILEAEAVHPFVLSKPPLMRALLVKLGGTEHVLMITAHHIVVDAWSMTILWRELFALYQAKVEGAQPSLPPLRVQFADWASWHRLRSQSTRVQDHVKYWTQQLAGAPTVLELPADRVRPAIPRHRGSHQLLRIPERLTAQLRELGRGQGATLFMTLLAGWKALLHHYAGTSDIVVAAPVAGRSTPESENLVGCFVNPLVLRTSLAGDPTFSELLRRVRTTSLGAYAHQDAPFERVVEALDLTRDPRRHPVFQVLFSMQSFPGSSRHTTAARH